MLDGVRRGCVFCRIIRGETVASVVFEDDTSLAFLDHRPLLPGHCLLIPKAHHKKPSDLPANAVGPLFATAQLLARAAETGMNADACSWQSTTGSARACRTCMSTSSRIEKRTGSLPATTSGNGSHTTMTRRYARSRNRFTPRSIG